MNNDLLTEYRKNIRPALQKELGLKNIMAVPQIKKVVLNVGAGEALGNAKVLDAVSDQIATVTGQKPVINKAKVSIAAFKLRAGEPVGVSVTLRGKRAYDFVQRLITIVLPRVRDFSGISLSGFDKQGNYTLGLREQIVFPEIEYDKIDRIRGMEITIVTTARNGEEGRLLLAKMGMPFKKV